MQQSVIKIDNGDRCDGHRDEFGDPQSSEGGCAAAGWHLHWHDGPSCIAAPVGESGGIALPAYQPDSVWAYEIGLRNSFLDRNLIMNAPPFYNASKEIQFVAVGFVQGVTIAYVENDGKAHTLGVEFETQARPTPNLDLSVAMTVLDARVDRDNAAVETSHGGVRAGDHLPGSPTFASGENIRYTSRELPDNASAFIDLSHQYVGKSYNGFNRTNATVRPYGGWHRVDLAVGYERDRYTLAAFVNHLLDSDTVTNLIPTNPVRVTRQRPRSISL